jgi:predicted phage baseplate assembly protein
MVQQEDGSYEEWVEVPDFSQSSSADKHFVCDTTVGEIQFGPSIREPNGEMRQYGAIPPRGKLIKMSAYRYGGGSVGNVGKNTLTVLKSSIPYVGGVINRRAAAGGTDPETVESAKLRAPQMFRTRNRAVTENDFEFLALEVSPSVARAKCVQPQENTNGDSPPPGVVIVLLIPQVSTTEGYIPPEEFELSREVKEEVRSYLDERRLLSTMLVISEPSYHWVSVEARVKVKARLDPAQVRQEVEKKLYRFINPLWGGPEGDGWPFGRDLIISEVYSCIQSVEGVEYVEEAHICPVDMATKGRGQATQRVVIPRTGVLCSHDHQITMF